MSRFGTLPRRLVHVVIVLFGITLVTFFLLRLIPGDPALAILGSSYTHTRAVAIDNFLGLNKPIWTQYGQYMDRLFHGNLGFSFFYDQSATAVIGQHVAPTVFLVIYSAVLAALISLPIGFISGTAPRRRGRPDGPRLLHAQLRDASLLARHHLDPDLQRASHIFPISGFGRGFAGHMYYLFLPALTIALGFSTVLVRSLRAATIATLQAEFVDTARMKGIRWSRVLWKHVFRNSVLAVVAVYGVNLAYLIGGTVLVENVFSLPGLGSLLVSSVTDRDYPVVQGVTLLFAVLIVPDQSLHGYRPGGTRSPRRPGDRHMSAMWAASPSELLMQVATKAAGRQRSVARRRLPLIIGLAMLVIAILAAVFAPLLVSQSPTAIDVLHPLSAPFTAGHWLGTDQYGRDLLARILYGGAHRPGDRVRRDHRHARGRHDDRPGGRLSGRQGR